MTKLSGFKDKTWFSFVETESSLAAMPSQLETVVNNATMDTRPPTPLDHDPRFDRPAICGPDEVETPYPVYMKGAVQHGFKRGSKDLGCPTGELRYCQNTGE